MARIGWIFGWLYLFSICGYFTGKLGYRLFCGQNPNGIVAILFLLFGGGALALALQLIKACTEAPPAWYTSLIGVQHPDADKLKTPLIIMYASIYVVVMTALIGEFSLERIAIPFAIGLLTFLVLTSLLRVSVVLYMIWKNDRKHAIPAEKV